MAPDRPDGGRGVPQGPSRVEDRLVGAAFGRPPRAPVRPPRAALLPQLPDPAPNHALLCGALARISRRTLAVPLEEPATAGVAGLAHRGGMVPHRRGGDAARPRNHQLHLRAGAGRHAGQSGQPAVLRGDRLHQGGETSGRADGGARAELGQPLHQGPDPGPARPAVRLERAPPEGRRRDPRRAVRAHRGGRLAILRQMVRSARRPAQPRSVLPAAGAGSRPPHPALPGLLAPDRGG